MNFKEWSEKYYPDEDNETLHKMSHAWASGHANMAAAKIPEPSQFDLIEALTFMAEQYLATTEKADILTHNFMTAGECCLSVLERLNFVETDDGVYYRWTKESPPEEG